MQQPRFCKNNNFAHLFSTLTLKFEGHGFFSHLATPPTPSTAI